MISSDGIPDIQQTEGTFYISNRSGFNLGTLEERRIVNISGGLLPLVQHSSGRLKFIPTLSALGNSAVYISE